MPTSTEQHAPEEDAPTRGLFSARASAISIVIASLATLGVVFVILSSTGSDKIEVQSIPAQTNPVSQRAAAPVPTQAASPPVRTQAPEPVPAQAAPAPVPTQAPEPALAMDSRGFIDSSARCDPSQRAVAIARTAKAAMVVCQGADGSYEYQGMRLQDGASLQLDDVRPMAAGFEARNRGTTYRLSPTELVVISGEALQSRDAVVEYRVG